MAEMRIWELLPNLFQAVRRDHEEVNLVGHHDFVHAARVGEIAYQIALDEYHEAIAMLAGAAGLCHNADRILQKKFGVGRREMPKNKVAEIVRSQLATEKSWNGTRGSVTEKQEIGMIVDAVLGHDGKNSPDDSQVLIALMDADRVVNLGLDNIIRSGQLHHDLPAVDYKNWLSDPEANYRNPRSALYDIACSLEWVDPSKPVCVRTRLGKKLAEERAGAYRQFVETLRLQLQGEGIIPYPFD